MSLGIGVQAEEEKRARAEPVTKGVFTHNVSFDVGAFAGERGGPHRIGDIPRILLLSLSRVKVQLRGYYGQRKSTVRRWLVELVSAVVRGIDKFGIHNSSRGTCHDQICNSVRAHV